ncbi:hypothetical protein G9A89_000524 [Geosiphon pyriformis]|nr:hypothetical protein G9A89_000524 [Geosiphon pyriformis]
MRGSNPRLLAHKTNTLPAELMELLNKGPSILGRVVKALDLSPSGLSPRGFEPRRMHFLQKCSAQPDSNQRPRDVNLPATVSRSTN